MWEKWNIIEDYNIKRSLFSSSWQPFGQILSFHLSCCQGIGHPVQTATGVIIIWHAHFKAPNSVVETYTILTFFNFWNIEDVLPTETSTLFNSRQKKKKAINICVVINDPFITHFRWISALIFHFINSIHCEGAFYNSVYYQMRQRSVDVDLIHWYRLIKVINDLIPL